MVAPWTADTPPGREPSFTPGATQLLEHPALQLYLHPTSLARLPNLLPPTHALPLFSLSRSKSKDRAVH